MEEDLQERDCAMTLAKMEKEVVVYVRHQLDEEHAALVKLQEEARGDGPAIEAVKVRALGKEAVSLSSGPELVCRPEKDPARTSRGALEQASPLIEFETGEAGEEP
ncbi:uncharacterized protein A4U43_C01F13720 [Asparagus officinalis]|uniref:Uncharacterized protein n=1 Tax=Asparagus officinalis TaxID=4686 RepID=A0A5P1FPY2_ASPOF|nr:uncharacterized protein A4U43_C01F13720 [Asparagus officinalis]